MQPILRVRGGWGAAGGTQISGLALIGVRDTNDTDQDYGLIITSLPDFRVDRCYFEGSGFAGLRVEGASSGFVDHAILVDNFKHGVNSLGYGVVVHGAGRWATEVQAGGALATFAVPNCLDARADARIKRDLFEIQVQYSLTGWSQVALLAL